MCVLFCLDCREEGVDPLFESSLYDCTPCVELIGGLVSYRLGYSIEGGMRGGRDERREGGMRGGRDG